ncbi:TetR/AcrR family transcriptional regulator [Gordonia sp. TBRC 11910]|uniref:TetR/AcrR family transcriptional regulator n=1 Tax=Gordonia asplenii TaxID=2725283 RepID=A0A848KU23_9ACTN|nr:TetR/AcrR family transcriptional regulator [Gordonia asplenii]NMO01699.1 TetR/AcrR family transcriptional regulator [Gordonia asplenii]
MPAADTTRRERKRVHTRRRLYEAAIQLFEEKGYDPTSMDEIAELADTARATLYNYFPRKSAFLEEWTVRRRDQVGIDLAEYRDRPTDEVIRAYLRDLVRINIEQATLTRVLLPAWVRSGGPVEEEPYLAAALTEYVRLGQQRGEIRTDCDPVLVGHLIRNAYLGALYLWLHSLNDGPALDLRAAVDDSADIILRGLST